MLFTFGFLFCTILNIQASIIPSLFRENFHQLSKRETDDEVLQRIQQSGNLNFDSTFLPNVREGRRIACFFVFDKEASDDLNDNIRIAQRYATLLATLATRYTAHANITIVNAGVELWSSGDQIEFKSNEFGSAALPDYLTQFQGYLERTQKSNFGRIYAIGVLLTNKANLGGGFSHGLPCSTSGTSIMRYRPVPWNIAPLLAHELAHTLSVVHPMDLPFACEAFPALKFCASSPLPAECTCTSPASPPEQCLMTFSFGRARINAPRYTPCDIEMMNYFSSNIPCLAP